ncbi:MAG: helix-turn-helix transcriptional regulator [Verrucomicrobia bacterium]|nr:helix-turn-helix transcriptional regulator [Verrucomicrobiota bacterium]
MLIYVGRGVRRYGESPVALHQRRGWEFQAVLRGAIAPMLPEGPDFSPKKRLWLFPPLHQHGWIAGKGSEAEVVVFHFLSLPAPLKTMVERIALPLDIALDDEACRRLRDLAGRVAYYWSNPSPAMMMCNEQALMELSLLVYESLSKDEAPPAADRSGWFVVQRAMQVFAENLPENLSQEDLARRVGVSASHLRRLFHEVLHLSPKQMLDQMRFQRATQLMADPATKLESVGEQCGFGSASAFSRAFRHHFGCSPQAWRS